LFVLLSLALALVGCRGASEGITVFAAASLTNVLQPLGAAFTQAHGAPVRFNFGGSTDLAQQLIRGAPADLFIAAGSSPMDLLASRRLLVADSRTAVLKNTLVLVGRTDGPAAAEPQELLSDRFLRVAVADPQLAPAGVYARAALGSLGLWEGLQPKLVPALDVRTALAYVQRGDADAAVVYATDALGREGVRVLLAFPPESYPEVAYPAAVLQSSRHPEAARAFIAFLRSEAAQAVMRAQGWAVPDFSAAAPRR
jgi:molybdate transport system substrate-binding protein